MRATVGACTSVTQHRRHCARLQVRCTPEIGLGTLKLTNRRLLTMRHRDWSLATVAATILAAVLAWPTAGSAQTVTGQAAAVQATVFGLLGNTSLGLANTGALSGPTDALEASQLTGNLLGALTAEVPAATTI